MNFCSQQKRDLQAVKFNLNFFSHYLYLLQSFIHLPSLFWGVIVLLVFDNQEESKLVSRYGQRPALFKENIKALSEPADVAQLARATDL